MIEPANPRTRDGDLPYARPFPEMSEALEKEHRHFLQHGICVGYLSFPRSLNANAGTVLQRCLSQVNKFRDRIGRKLSVFKLGLTASPVVRFSFYQEANYTHMTLLHVSPNLGLCQMLEAALIASNISETGCRNERFGGEGPPTVQEPFHYVYVVGARADRFKPIR